MQERIMIGVMCMAISFNSISQIKYPYTPTEDVSDTYHDTVIKDPYRWLEDDYAERTAGWVKEQNALTDSVLSTISFKESLRSQIASYYNYPKYSAPFHKGKYWLFSKNEGLQNQPVWYIMDSLNATPEVLIDPNAMDKNGLVSINIIGFNYIKNKMAYTASIAGSDWKTIYVMDLKRRKRTVDSVPWVKFTNAAFLNDAFMYSQYDVPTTGLDYKGPLDNSKIMVHKLGTSHTDDFLGYGTSNRKENIQATVSEKADFIILTKTIGTSGTEVSVVPLGPNKSQGGKVDPLTLFKGYATDNYYIHNEGLSLYFITNLNAPNGKVVKIDYDNPQPEKWLDFIPEQKEKLLWVNRAGNKYFCCYLKDCSSKVVQYSAEGKLEQEIKLPGIGTVSGFEGEKNDSVTFYKFSSFTDPGTIYLYNIKDGTSKTWFSPERPTFNPNMYETKQVFFKSKDGTQVPMFIVSKKKLKKKGNNPCLLYGYGGFNIAQTPAYNPARMAFLENGGVFVLVNLRGGSEYGEAWHKAGMLENKQHVFDDFISAAEYLIQEKYTSKKLIAITGRSNGGLLTSACLLQRPDLFGAAVPVVGVHDMLRYHKFTVGRGWAVEYGVSDSLNQFNYLIKYSPLHNVKPTAYPPTFITTADHDDRVVPAHSFKFAATLQQHQSGQAPVLLRIYTNAGHGAGKSIEQYITEDTEAYSFLMHYLGMKL